MNKPETAGLPDVFGGIPGRYWQTLADGRIECNLCPRNCKLRDGQRGLCFVRARQGNQLLLTAYGRSSGFSIDPIEKKPLNHFLPGTPVLSFGTAGCNLTCKFCQNWDISKARSLDRLQSEALPEAIVRAAIAAGSRAIAYTYNDPVIFLEYAVDVAKAAREQDIKNVAVTAGYISGKAREESFSVMDAANIDLKAFTGDFYRALCSARLGPVLETLKYVKHETKVWLEITTLLIPGYNDKPREIGALSEWISTQLGPDVPLHFSAFHPDWKMRDVPHTPASTLRIARSIARSAGLRHVYTSNVRGELEQSTYCHACGTCLIGRDWYEITSWTLNESGCCLRCGAPCPGVFEDRPGSWGARRMPVDLPGS
jgi:pyruvate formate lyase activating enzyme